LKNNRYPSQPQWCTGDNIVPTETPFHLGHNPHDADSNYTIPVLGRRYSSDIYQAGVTPGLRSSWWGQGVPDQPN